MAFFRSEHPVKEVVCALGAESAPITAGPLGPFSAVDLLSANGQIHALAAADAIPESIGQELRAFYQTS